MKLTVEKVKTCSRCGSRMHTAADCAVDPVALAMKQEPAIREAKKAYRKSHTFEVDSLLSERRKWQRRLTIATNKLSEIDVAIRDLAVRNALLLDGNKLDAAEEKGGVK